MSRARYLTGDVRDVMATIADDTFDLVLTSPPFLALRSYLPPDHPDKHREIGSEPTPAEFIDTMLALTAEWDRLLAPHGSIAVELGDTYSGSGGAGGDYDTGKRPSDRKFTGSALADRKNKVLNENGQRMQQGEGWPLEKSMCFIPHAYAMSLAYGRNILTGDESPAGSWRVRNVVAWCRPNPAVGALGDKFRPATSYMVIATKARDRYFDLDAVRTPLTAPDKVQRNGGARTDISRDPTGKKTNELVVQNPAGAPPLDWWEIPTESYRGSHYATWPRKLLDRPILAMVPREVCTVCGEPRRRITGGALTLDSYRASTRPQTIRAVEMADAAGLTDEHIAAVRAFGTSDAGKATTLNSGAGRNSDAVKRLAGEAKAVLGGYFREFVMSTNAATSTSGWTDCGHDSYRRGHVLDPFGGSGTTAAVAVAHGRDCTLIDLDERNVDLARERVGMFLEVPETEDAA